MMTLTKGPASPFYADHRGENQVVPCFLQACGRLLGVILHGMRGQVCLTKRRGFLFLLLQCLSYFCSYLHPHDGMRQSIGWFHGLVSERALQELKRWVIIKSSSC